MMESRHRADSSANMKYRKEKSYKIIPSMAASPLSPTSGAPLQEIHSKCKEKASPAFKLLAANQRKAEILEEMDADYPPVEGSKSASLPRQKRQTDKENSLPHPEYSSRSLPRYVSKSTSHVPFKAPTWYKDMYKEMHTSMEKESQLTKLLASDAKSGAFGDQMSYGAHGSAECIQSATYEDAPRRLRDSRATADRPIRKSLPNIHAANYDFMQDHYKNNSTTKQTTTTTTTTKQRLLQKKSREFEEKIEAERLRLELKEEELKLKEHLLKRQKQEEENRYHNRSKSENLSHREHEEQQWKLREEEIRHKQHEETKQREEIKLIKQKEEELRRKEEMLAKKEKELDELRLLKLKDKGHNQHKLEENHKRQETEEQQLRNLKQKELERKEQEKLRLFKLKEELQRKEEELQRKEAEQRRQQILLEESIKSKLPPFAKAKYLFQPQSPGELGFKKGDVVKIIRAVDEYWIEGEHNGDVGIFPMSYVELVDKLPGESVTIGKSSENITKDTLFVDITVHPIKKLSREEMNRKLSPRSTSVSPRSTSVGTQAEEPEITTKTDIPLENAPLENVEITEKKLNSNTQQEYIPDIDVVDEATSRRFTIQPGIAHARYTFKGETEIELSFKKGDEIAIFERIDDNWYEGECNGQIGILPSNYVKVSRQPIIKETEAPKHEPENKQNEIAQNSVLPSHEKEKKADSLLLVNGPNNTTVNDMIGQGDPYKAIHKYTSTNKDEIELRVGDIVHVLEKCDDNWFVGTSDRTGAFGIFPGNYVVPLNQW